MCVFRLLPACSLCSLHSNLDDARLLVSEQTQWHSLAGPTENHMRVAMLALLVSHTQALKRRKRRSIEKSRLTECPSQAMSGQTIYFSTGGIEYHLT